MQELFVNMGQIHALKSSGVLTTVGLGSCIGITLYDPVARVGGMGHVFLAESRNKDEAQKLPGKYADTGVPALLDAVIKQGARKERLVAKMAGGAHLFPNLSNSSLSVGDQNITAVTAQLNKLNIPITGKDVAGNHGRKMRLLVETGTVTVTAIGQQPMEI